MKHIVFAILIALATLTATTAVWSAPAWADSSDSSSVSDEAP